jgi:hypothetical protein
MTTITTASNVAALLAEVNSISVEDRLTAFTKAMSAYVALIKDTPFGELQTLKESLQSAKTSAFVSTYAPDTDVDHPYNMSGYFILTNRQFLSILRLLNSMEEDQKPHDLLFSLIESEGFQDVIVKFHDTYLNIWSPNYDDLIRIHGVQQETTDIGGMRLVFSHTNSSSIYSSEFRPDAGAAQAVRTPGCWVNINPHVTPDEALYIVTKKWGRPRNVNKPIVAVSTAGTEIASALLCANNIIEAMMLQGLLNQLRYLRDIFDGQLMAGLLISGPNWWENRFLAHCLEVNYGVSGKTHYDAVSDMQGMLGCYAPVISHSRVQEYNNPQKFMVVLVLKADLSSDEDKDLVEKLREHTRVVNTAGQGAYCHSGHTTVLSVVQYGEDHLPECGFMNDPQKSFEIDMLLGTAFVDTEKKNYDGEGHDLAESVMGFATVRGGEFYSSLWDYAKAPAYADTRMGLVGFGYAKSKKTHYLLAESIGVKSAYLALLKKSLDEAYEDHHKNAWKALIDYIASTHYEDDYVVALTRKNGGIDIHVKMQSFEHPPVSISSSFKAWMFDKTMPVGITFEVQAEPIDGSGFELTISRFDELFLTQDRSFIDCPVGHILKTSDMVPLYKTRLTNADYVQSHAFVLQWCMLNAIKNEKVDAALESFFDGSNKNDSARAVRHERWVLAKALQPGVTYEFADQIGFLLHSDAFTKHLSSAVLESGARPANIGQEALLMMITRDFRLVFFINYPGVAYPARMEKDDRFEIKFTATPLQTAQSHPDFMEKSYTRTSNDEMFKSGRHSYLINDKIMDVESYLARYNSIPRKLVMVVLRALKYQGETSYRVKTLTTSVLSESEIAQSLLETVAVTQRKLRFENAITERTVIELVNARASNRNKLIRLIDMLQDAKRVEEVEHIRWALSNLAK